MKMRRTLAAMMSGILAMSPAGVIFADEAAQTPVTYGDMISLSLTQDGETLSADITAVYNESGDSCDISDSPSINDGHRRTCCLWF